MKILILGSDGYIGHPLTLHLLKQGHQVFGIDDFSRRRRVNELGSGSITPISYPLERLVHLKQFPNFEARVNVSLGNDSPGYISSILDSFKPDTIVHLAEQPSAPWSMKSPEYASATQRSNVIGTLHLLWAIMERCPSAHLVKIGTMGEYGTPECDIPEGFIPATCLGYEMASTECPMQGLLFPRTAGSFYHLSKVHDTLNIEFACRTWGLCSTDIMQGVVFGLWHETDDESEITRFDYDECFGTVINRFCAQALIGHPLTIYGLGHQIRGFLPLKDSIQCLTIAITNPPKPGEYRTFNQFENIYRLDDLAEMVQKGAQTLGLKVDIKHLTNPRVELERHYYNPNHNILFELGYNPTTDIQKEITSLIRQLYPYRDRINKEVILPVTKWR